jgi:hypothetical protein
MLQELASLNLLDQVVNFQGGATAYDLVHALAGLVEAVTIWKKTQNVFPANKFASHRQTRTVRVHSAFLVQHFHCILD